jgi:hypothetical protein
MVPGIVLEPVNDYLNLSNAFDRNEVVNQINELLKDKKFKVDEDSLQFKIAGNRLFAEGFAIPWSEPISIYPRMNYSGRR